MTKKIIRNKDKGKVHFIGICGAGMGALAVMMKTEGYTVSGSDEGFYDPVFSYLKRHNIKALSPHKRENIPKDADLIIIGKHAKLNKEDNEEMQEALKYPDRIKSFPEVLRDITKNKENIVVCGSYGKSTTSALLAWCMIGSGIDAGYFIGGIVNGMEESAHLGESKYFILEGDEYPAYNGKLEGQSKFLYYEPKDVLLTSAEHDHVNVFPTLESYIEPYEKLVAMLSKDSKNGILVAGINNPNVQRIAKKYAGEIITYGMEDTADWYPKNIIYGKVTTFDLFNKGEKITELSTTLLGSHNIENIVGVSAYLLGKNIISPESLKKSVATFRGLSRRIDLKTDKSSVLVYEGFGSSYTKAKTVFDAIRIHFRDKRIVTIFEPHTFSWRNKNNLSWYDDIFKESDETLIYKPPEHGGDTHDQATLEEIVKAVKNSKVYGVLNKEEAFAILEKIIKPDDLIILMSSGDLGGLIAEVPLWAEKKFPKTK